MTILAKEQDLYLRQGDTGNIIFQGIPKDKNYQIYISVYNPDSNTILKEIECTTFTQSTGVVLFAIGEELSNSLPVGDWEYGLKICASGSEDTILPRSYIDEAGDLIHDPAPKFTVDYKYVEGD